MNRLNILLASLLLGIVSANAQEVKQFTLQQAQSYALENNYDKLSADKDVLIAKRKVWETTAIGLPQVNAEGTFQNFIDIPTTLVPANAFNPAAPADQYMALQFGTDYNTTGQVSVSQLLFDGSYIVGLQAAKTYKEFSTKNLEKTERDVNEEVAKAYYLVLIAEENITILKGIAENTESLLEESTKIFDEGLIEEDNVDQLKLTLNDLKNSLSEAERQQSIAKNLLKYQIGMDIKEQIELTDKLESFVNNEGQEWLAKEFDFNGHIDYELTLVNQRLKKLSLRREKYSFAPSIGAFLSHQQSNMGNEFNAFNSDAIYYPTTLWGISVKLPIFTSGMRLAKVSQAKLDFQKAELMTKKVEQGLQLQAEQARSEFNAASDIYNNQKEALAIAEKLNNNMIKKYNEGIAGSLDLSQTQNQLLSAEGKYIKALLDLLNAKSNLKKALNN